MKLAFMAGLPRTGTNLIASIFAQRDTVFLSGNSSLSDYMRTIDNVMGRAEDYRLGVMRDNHDSLIRNICSAFYANQQQPFIIDKSRIWGVPYFLRMLRNVTGEDPKIITPVRPLHEVVASFVYKAQQYPGVNFIDRAMVEEDFLPYWRKPIDDARVDWLLRPGGMIDTAMLSVWSAHDPETAEMFYVYSYDDLVNDPHSVISNICDFIGAPRDDYDLREVSDNKSVNDVEVLGILGFYQVRSKISKTSPRPEDVLSQYGVERCFIEDFWTDR